MKLKSHSHIRLGSCHGGSDVSPKSQVCMQMSARPPVSLTGPLDVSMELILITLEQVMDVPKIGHKQHIATTKLESSILKVRYL